MSTDSEVTYISGTVTAYEGNGRKLGYPTANIQSETTLKDGVYFGYADLSSYISHPALIFIGKPITVGAQAHRVEAHLLDIYDVDYYKEKLNLYVQYFHRPNIHFSSIDELLVAMKSDEKAARKWFSVN